MKLTLLCFTVCAAFLLVSKFSSKDLRKLGNFGLHILIFHTIFGSQTTDAFFGLKKGKTAEEIENGKKAFNFYRRSFAKEYEQSPFPNEPENVTDFLFTGVEEIFIKNKMVTEMGAVATFNSHFDRFKEKYYKEGGKATEDEIEKLREMMEKYLGLVYGTYHYYGIDDLLKRRS